MRFASLFILLFLSSWLFANNEEVGLVGPICSNAGTLSDPSDDTFTYSLRINGPPSFEWEASDSGSSTGEFGEWVTFGPYLITDGTVAFEITDTINLCVYEVSLEPPSSSCSGDWDEVEWEDSEWFGGFIPTADECECIRRIEAYSYNGDFVYFFDSYCEQGDWYDYYVDYNGQYLCIDAPFFQGVDVICSEELVGLEYVGVLFECDLPIPCEEDLVIESNYSGCSDLDCAMQTEATEHWCFEVDVFPSYITTWSINSIDYTSGWQPTACLTFYDLQQESALVCAHFAGDECSTEICTEVTFVNECVSDEACLVCDDFSFVINGSESIEFNVFDGLFINNLEGPFVIELIGEAPFGILEYEPDGTIFYEPVPSVAGSFSLEYVVCTEDGLVCCNGNTIEITVNSSCGDLEEGPWLPFYTPVDDLNCECVERIDFYEYQGNPIYFLDSQCNYFDEPDFFADCNGITICGMNGFLPPTLEECTEQFLSEITFVENYFECAQVDPCVEEVVVQSEYINCTGTDDIPQSQAAEEWCFSTPGIAAQVSWTSNDVVLTTGLDPCFIINSLQENEPEICAQIVTEDCSFEVCADFTFTGNCNTVVPPTLDCSDLSLEAEGLSAVSTNILDLVESDTQEDIEVSVDETSDFGTITYDQDGAFAFTAFSNSDGVATINYEACLQNSNVCCQGIISIAVSPEDGAMGPEVTADFYTIESESLVICPLENDAFDSEEFSFEWTFENEGLIVSDQNDNCLLVEVGDDVDVTATYSGAYTVCLPNNSCSTASFEFTFPENPDLMPDFYTIASDSLLICPLENDNLESDQFSFEWTFENEDLEVNEQNDNCLLMVINGNAELDEFYSGSYTVCFPNNICSSSSFELAVPVGLDDLGLDFKVYPNPTALKINVDSEDELLETLSLFAVSGKMVRESVVDGNSASINVSDLSSGVYLLVIKSENVSRVERIVVE